LARALLGRGDEEGFDARTQDAISRRERRVNFGVWITVRTLLHHAREARLRRDASRIFIVGVVEVDSVVESRSSVDQLE
jgi:predicted RNA-binding protein